MSESKTTPPDDDDDREPCILCDRVVPLAEITRCESGEPVCDDCWPSAVRAQAEDIQREEDAARVH